MVADHRGRLCVNLGVSPEHEGVCVIHFGMGRWLKASEKQHTSFMHARAQCKLAVHWWPSSVEQPKYADHVRLVLKRWGTGCLARRMQLHV